MRGFVEREKVRSSLVEGDGDTVGASTFFVLEGLAIAACDFQSRGTKLARRYLVLYH